MYFLLNIGIFQCHVSVQGCNSHNDAFSRLVFIYNNPNFPFEKAAHNCEPLNWIEESENC